MEMGRRDLMKRGGTNRFPNKQSGSGFSEKSKKKGMLKKLKQETMMMSYEQLSHPPSDLEFEVSKKKSKLPKKNSKDSNGVDHASVPRKLRSAMKKRNLESVSKLSSSASKRLNRSKTGIESCYKDLIKKENQEMEAKDVMVNESMMISKDEKEVAETLYGLAEMFADTDSIDHKKTCHVKETSKVDSSLVVEADYTTKAESLEPVLSSSQTKQIDEMPLEQSSNFINILKQSSSSVNVTGAPVNILIPPATSDADSTSNGLALWPGLSPTNVHSRADQVLLSKPSSTKLPPWMMGQATTSTSKTSSLLSEPFIRVQPRLLKKCASHIHICRLIKVLQTSKSSLTTTLNQPEQRFSEMSERRLPDPVTTTTTISDFKTMVSPSTRYQNPHFLDTHRNRTHNPKPVEEDMTQLGLELYGPPHTSQKQSYDFLTLSSASGATQSHLPLPNSFPQYHISKAYNNQLSPATSSHQVQQVSSYLASRLQTAYNANQQQQQQLRKRLWDAQYRPPLNSIMPSNQYSKPNLSLNLTSMQQPIQVASSPRYINNNNVSQQQQRFMAAAAAMSMNHHQNNNHSRAVMNRQEHHFPLIYEDTRTPLQLLCNEQS